MGLILGPLSLAAATVLQWVAQQRQGTDGLEELIASERGLWLSIVFISVFGPIAWLAGLPAVLCLVPEAARGRRLTWVGTALLGLGLVAGVGHLALYFGLQTMLADARPGAAALTAMSAAADVEPLSTVLLVLFLGAFSVGPILLTVGLRRARAVAVWVPVAAIVMTVAGFAGGMPAGIVQLALLLAVFGAIIAALPHTGSVRRARPARGGFPVPRTGP